MQLTLSDRNIVALVTDAVPSRYGEYWLISEQIVDKFVGNKLFTPVLGQASTKSVTLLITTDRLQVSLKDAADGRLGDLSVLQTFLEKAPELQVTGIGLNFEWKVSFEEDEVPSDKLNAICGGNSPFLDSAQIGESVVGFELFKVAFGGRRRIKVSPVFDNRTGVEVKAVTINFNYHFQTDGTTDEKLVSWSHALKQTSQAFNDAKKIADTFLI